MKLLELMVGDRLTEFYKMIDTESTPNGCHEWIGSRLKAGYGRFRVVPGDNPDMRLRSHRIALCLETEIEYDNPLNVLHACDNPPCCNVEHLSWGTQAENMADAKRKGRATNRGRTPTLRLKDSEILEILLDIWNTDLELKDIAEMRGVSRPYVSMIYRGESKRVKSLIGN